jgi:hypothetical protein
VTQTLGPNSRAGRSLYRYVRVYEDALSTTVRYDVVARAKNFAEKVYRLYIICEGVDEMQTRGMQALAAGPTRHKLWKAGDKWKSDIGDVPKRLGSSELEDWLWMREYWPKPGRNVMRHWNNEVLLSGELGIELWYLVSSLILMSLQGIIVPKLVEYSTIRILLPELQEY